MQLQEPEDWLHTFITASQPERRQCPYNTKDILREYCTDLALGRIRSVDGESSTGRSDNLLFLCARKLSEYCLRDSRRWLDCERVHKHTRSRSHLAGPHSTRLQQNTRSSYEKVPLRRRKSSPVFRIH